ncbi:MAG TPA: L-aspartate oxidase [Candidatus Hydrogenedentes bacterium]|nr:L-aspartate oxidase [Candidatus Hydrogenedentota bacterium]
MALQTDVLVIGCGIAGAAAALRLARDSNRQVLVITRAPLPDECNTRYAQGGIVCRGPDDNPDLLEKDILEAGSGCCFPEAVRLLVEEGPDIVQRVLMEESEVHFDRNREGVLAYAREGGHSKRRILHVGDATGHAIITGLVSTLKRLPNVTLRTDLTAVDLITSAHHDKNPVARYRAVKCYGAYVFDTAGKSIHRVLARATVLATGGIGRVYRHTTNPEGARGDGLAMAYRAGARIINAEYVQFHPTTLAVPGANNFLISEAVRGEGGRLFTPDGRAFMEDYSPQWKDLAPRDIVARAIHTEMITHGYSHVLLDLAACMSGSHIRERFPTIYATCLEAGIDVTAEPVPVVPAAHYFCGGVLVDLCGRTTIDSLYAAGEVSCTGVHGANRLASTSLLEGLVWGDRAAGDILERNDLCLVSEDRIPPWEEVGSRESPDPALIHRDCGTIQDTMWLYVGLTRSSHRLSRALYDLDHLLHSIEQFYRASQINDALIGLRNMAQASKIIAQAAWHNRRSCGTHYREDAIEPPHSALYDLSEPRFGQGLEF